MKTNVLEFHDFDDFVEWKCNIEVNTKARFVKARGDIARNKYTATKYVCHRSGQYVQRGRGLRKLKKNGSNKIDGCCPACITVHVYHNDKCKVFFREQHVGHENDLERLFLTAKERELLASKLAQRIPFNDILDEIRESAGPQAERIHLVTRRDLFNIQKNLKLQTEEPLSTASSPSINVVDEEITPSVAEEKEKLLSKLIPDLQRIVESIICMEQIEAFKEFCASIEPTILAIGSKFGENEQREEHPVPRCPSGEGGSIRKFWGNFC